MFNCKFCSREAKRQSDISQHQKHCVNNPERIPRKPFSNETREKISAVWRGRKHSDETKSKISKSRTEYLIKNPSQVPYLLNHYSNGASYPEKYFKKFLETNNVDFQDELRISIYRLDFAIANKINLEIDGEQHYIDERIVKSNTKRDSYLSSLGWKVIRIRWSTYKKLSLSEQEKFRMHILDEINGFNS